MPRRSRRAPVVAIALALVLAAGGWTFYRHGRSIWVPWTQRFTGRQTVDQVVAAVDAGAGARMRAALRDAGVSGSPSRLWLLALKDRKTLTLYAEDASGRRVRVRTWPVLAASGGPGPKLRAGDRQVPEGVYRIDRLNPNSAYHLSLGLDYPNAADRDRAARDGRTKLGGDIFVHGNDVSIGCLAIGDDAVEELFWLAGTAGKDAFTVVIAPTDLRVGPAPAVDGPAWLPALYGELRRELARFPPG